MDGAEAFAPLRARQDPWLCALSQGHARGRGERYSHAMVVRGARRPGAFFVFDATPVAGLSYSKLSTRRFLRYLTEHLPQRLLAPDLAAAEGGRMTCVPCQELAGR